MADLKEISLLLQQGRAKAVKELVEAAIAEGIAPLQILEEGLLSGMSIVGEKFKNNEVFVPEVLIAARAMNMGTAVLKPYLAAAGVEAKGIAVIGTVQGDLHDIGKNLVKMMLEGKGLTVIDLGVDVPADKFVDAAVENKATVICCSSLLTTTMGQMQGVVEAAVSKGQRGNLKIMVGGAPVTQTFCEEIGADAYAADAASAAELALSYCS